MKRQRSSSSKSSPSNGSAPSPYRSDSEPVPTPPSASHKRSKASGELPTVTGERLPYCVPKAQPAWFRNLVPWLQEVHSVRKLPVSLKSLAKEMYNQNSFVPLQQFLERMWVDYVAVGKARAPKAKSEQSKGSSSSSKKKSPSNDRRRGEEGADETNDNGEEGEEGADETNDNVEPVKTPQPAKPRGKPRGRVPKERLQAMKAEADSKLKVLLEKLNADAQGKAAVESLAEIVANALRSVEDLSEASPDPSQ